MTLLGAPAFRNTHWELIWHIPSPRPSVDFASPRARNLIFLGTFEERKGIAEMLKAWSIIRDRLPDAQLTIVGKGHLQHEIEAVAQRDQRMEIVLDPSRDEIFKYLARSKALILFSKPSPGWKEQVGLPIVEGLSAGCEIVTSDETGIRDWLATHEHNVVPVTAQIPEIAEATVRALTSERGPADIVGHLPTEDGRRTADSLIFASNQDKSWKLR
nr:glycosyltransferase [Arthrobacter sp. SF27]